MGSGEARGLGALLLHPYVDNTSAFNKLVAWYFQEPGIGICKRIPDINSKLQSRTSIRAVEARHCIGAAIRSSGTTNAG